jgi:hypothetical protein
MALDQRHRDLRLLPGGETGVKAEVYRQSDCVGKRGSINGAAGQGGAFSELLRGMREHAGYAVP